MRFVVLTNILSPYRRFLYDEMYNYFHANGDEFCVLLMAEGEPNRHWLYDEYKTNYTILLQKKILNKHDYVSGYYSKDLKKRLLQLKPHVVLASGAYIMLPVLQAILYKKELNYKLLFWSESNLVKRESISKIKWWVREIIRFSVYKCFDGFWNAGKLSDEFITKYKKKNSPSFFLPNLVDVGFYRKAGRFTEEAKDAIRRKYSLEKQIKVIICPARLSYEKGILEFLDLYKDAKSKMGAVLLFVGDGPLRAQIEDKICLIPADIRLLGYKSQDELLELYAVSDVFLLPSNIDPNPLSCIEALNVGLPLFISEHVGNNPEVVVQGVNGYVFSYRDKLAAVKMLDEMLVQDSSWMMQAREVSWHVADTIYNPKIAVENCIEEMKEKLAVSSI